MKGLRHVAIIMDGNGRWATARGRGRAVGHAAGATAVRRTVEAARRLSLPALTLYAFSSDNWRRPRAEVETLFSLFRSYLESETANAAANGIRIRILGRRDRLPRELLAAVERAEAATSAARDLLLTIAVDYSARDAICRAASRLAPGESGGPDRVPTREEFSAMLTGGGPGDVDLLIRTGGERRLSDFLLWECAYAELVFLDVAWPDFTEAHLESALRDFDSRERRFGGLPSEALARAV